jgi:hypothetical protein
MDRKFAWLNMNQNLPAIRKEEYLKVIESGNV